MKYTLLFLIVLFSEILFAQDTLKENSDFPHKGNYILKEANEDIPIMYGLVLSDNSSKDITSSGSEYKYVKGKDTAGVLLTVKDMTAHYEELAKKLGGKKIYSMETNATYKYEKAGKTYWLALQYNLIEQETITVEDYYLTIIEDK
ncbi:MAG: hypothetical protein HY841_10535 [Bacteroidetes bacterium]|nr:hypothetical protein [Bacteroidota bacterium]